MTQAGGGLSVRQRIATVLWFLLAVGFLLALPVLFGFSVWIPVLLAGLAAALALLVAWAVPLIFKRPRWGYGRRWLAAAAALLFGLSILAAAPIYYLAGLVAGRPLTVPQAVLSNGQKTIIFQGMTHVGSDLFYKSVVYDLQHALAEGYVAYYEGVIPDPAGEKWFSETLADGGDLNAEYQTLGAVCGLSFQGEYFKLLAGDIREHPDRHVAADVTTLQMKQEYERLVASDRSFAEKVEKAAKDKEDKAESADVLAKFLKWSQDGDPKHQTLGGVACRGAMNIVLSRRAANDLDPLLLDYRNRMLVERIVADPRPRIYVNYGSAHLPGVLGLLQKSDPKWKVVSVRWMRAIEAPEDLKGQI